METGVLTDGSAAATKSGAERASADAALARARREVKCFCILKNRLKCCLLKDFRKTIVTIVYLRGEIVYSERVTMKKETGNKGKEW